MVDIVFIASRAEGGYLVISLVRELYPDFGLFLFLDGIHRGHVWDRGSIGDGPLFAFRVLEPFRWAICACTNDWYKKQSHLQKTLLERTLGKQFLDPIERIARYLCGEQNLEPFKLLA